MSQPTLSTPDAAARDSLIDFPCPFPIKVMGLAQADFAASLAAVAQRFDPTFDAATIETRPSSGGKYVGLTLTVLATSRQQLDDLYRALVAHPGVKVVL